ncbi:PLP-dependent aminotransferase family protein [Clostridium estertheticum]|uniref:MocR-like pyridoxine biosynthesis transcription factor PdxR n=1 Tax=Clostridium estertheticum TaxID=238834 RepID=UPI001C7D0E56|nr:PLP-dependent aminotransferase family protein [Clostridium estertheticum]MBX4263340.1 PLP-dependent aminotransferase family protein [Clostridium estertheticum]WLC89632.1 PLP-dependent aminotransferase family protein [Clostridium estertheticum]
MIIIDSDINVPLYLQIYGQIKEKIILKQFLQGSKLPSTRILSTTLNVSRNTVESAYLQLCAEGYIESKAGSGFIVLKLDTSIISKLKSKNSKSSGETKNNLLEVKSFYKYDFKYGNIGASDFPLRIWHKISNKCLTSLTAEDMTSYSASKGELDLQIEIMEYLNKSRGFSCNPKQVIILPGLEYCLSMLSQLFRKDFNQIALEDPGHYGARNIFVNNGYDVIPIGLEKDGIDLEELENSSAKIVYITPSHQFPMGSVMPIQKRLKLLDWAMRKNGIIIEDDYDSELRYNSRPIPSIKSIALKENVVYIGTFSKALSPSLRINYMVLPQVWLERYDEIFATYQTSVPLIQQKTIQQFMHLGYFDTHLRKVCLANKRKHDLLIHTINEVMGDKVIIHGKNAGLHVLLEFNNGLREEEIIIKAKNYDVAVYPVSIFWMRPENYSNNMVMLGFGEINESEIVDGIKLLNDATGNVQISIDETSVNRLLT